MLCNRNILFWLRISPLANKNIHSLRWLQRDVVITILEFANDEVLRLTVSSWRRAQYSQR